jgi:hypothetical protein
MSLIHGGRWRRLVQATEICEAPFQLGEHACVPNAYWVFVSTRAGFQFLTERLPARAPEHRQNTNGLGAITAPSIDKRHHNLSPLISILILSRHNLRVPRAFFKLVCTILHFTTLRIFCKLKTTKSPLSSSPSPQRVSWVFVYMPFDRQDNSFYSEYSQEFLLFMLVGYKYKRIWPKY